VVTSSGKPIRIALGPEIWEGQKVGGISRYFNEIALALTEVKLEILLIVPQDYDGYFSHTNFKTISIKGFRDFRRAIRKLGEDGYIYHSTYYNSKNLRYAKGHGLRTVVTVFDFISEKFPEPKPRFRRIRNEKITSLALADRVISISHNTKKDLLEYSHINPEKVAVIPLASSFGVFEVNSSAENSRRQFILYVGKRDGYKNFDALLRAFAHGPSVKTQLKLIAFGGGEFSKQEVEVISSLGVLGKVINVQGTDEDLEDLYREAKLFVYPSLYEGFGLPLLEAMSLGCPVLASNTSSIPEVCGGASLHFNPNNSEELSELIESTLANKPLLDQLSQLGYSRSLEFSWEKTASLTLEVYKDLSYENLQEL
jgi:glycosyltransferase involved in cell wall biosynthesis